MLDAEPLAVAALPDRCSRTRATRPSQANWATRQQVVYAATNDGLLHAFWADVTSLQNNELWAMLPPAVMPNIGSTYPSSHALLLDGSPVVQDVVWDRTAGANADGGIWHTTLVAGYGPASPGYYAVDVTNPVATTVSGQIPTDDPDDLTVAAAMPVEGPVFRWQLTKMPSTNFQIFETGATPAVTTLMFDPGDGKGAREIGVAILPGGISAANGIAAQPTTPKGGASGCARAQTSDPSPTGYAARTAVHCWGTTGQPSDAVPGRAVTIVRLDTGEIVRVFGRNNSTYNDFPATDTLAIAKRVTNTPLDSPMTGTPVIYPNQVGTDTTKAFVPDADGTIWRFDLSDPSPANWSGQLYLDLYNKAADTTSTPWNDGQPVVVPPVLSLDNAAELVLNVATGAQSAFTNTGTNYVYSITEKAGTSAFQASVNWYLNMTTFPGIITGDTAGATGQRVSGPMTVFNGNLYFASFSAPQSTTTCVLGTALLWGMNATTALVADATGALQPCPRERRHARLHAAEHDETGGQLQPVRAQPIDDGRHPRRLGARDAELRDFPGGGRDRSVRRGRQPLRAVGVRPADDAVRPERAGRRQHDQRRPGAADRPAHAHFADDDRLVGLHPRMMRSWQGAAALATMVAACGCGKGEVAPAPAASASGAPSPVAALLQAEALPADHLAPDELVEGTEDAFGVKLPRVMEVEQRVRGGDGERSDVDEGAHHVPARAPGRRGRSPARRVDPRSRASSRGEQAGPVMDIVIAPAIGKMRMQLVRRPEIVPSTLPDEASRWRAAGLTPDGKLVDPTHVE